VAEKNELPSANLGSIQRLESQILFEDDAMIVLNKPSGMAVHGGSGLSFGVIEGLRALRPEARFLELVHRLDRDTSGVLLVAKKRSALRSLHEQLRVKTMRKQYLALVRGQWQPHVKVVNAPLRKNDLQSGERVVRVSSDGKPSETRFRIARQFAEATLVECSPSLAVPTRSVSTPSTPAIPSPAMTNMVRPGLMKNARAGLKRLFLHAWKLTFTHPVDEREMQVEAPLSPELEAFLAKLPR
jgi:23S rRNA pseudouridine955/2504/2580 synthase